MPRDAALRPGARVAFFGSTALMGKELRALLEQRAFPAADVRLYDDRDDGALSEYDGEALVVTRPDEEAMTRLDIAFLCGAREAMVPYLDLPGRAGFAAIDLSGGASARPGVPLIHTEINPGEIRPPLIAAPHPLSHNLATVVHVARQVAPVAGVEALALTPVSELGEPAISELYQQAVGLLSFAEVPTEVLGRQVAFNLILSEGLEEGSAARSESRACEETERLLGLADGSVSVRSALAPIFHGHTMHVELEFERAPDPGDLAAVYEAARGTRLVTDLSEFSPVGLAGEERVAVAALRAHRRHPERWSLWTFCDNLKGGSTLNAARIAERLADRVLEVSR